MMLTISCDVKPTENPDKLVQAIKKIFPDAELELKTSSLEGRASFDEFKKLCEEQKAELALNELAEKGYADLSKLAALEGKVALDENFPLGKIRIKPEQ